MFEKIIDNFSTSEKRVALYSQTCATCFMILVIGGFFVGKMAYNGIQKEVVTFENGLTYDVLTGRNPQVRIEVGELTYRSICLNTEERSNHICRKSFDNHHFIGKDVRFLVHKMEDNNTYQGVILSGIFIGKSDNVTHQVKPTEEELNSVDDFYNWDMLFSRFLLLGSIIGILISIIGMVRESIVNKE